MKLKLSTLLISISALLTILLTPALLGAVAGISFSPVLTGSMRPAMNPGALLITRQAQASTLKVGEVAILQEPNSYIYYAHRITAIKSLNSNQYLTTKGDNNPLTDPFTVALHGNQMVPVAFKVIPLAGWPIIALSSPIGKVLTALFLLAALLISAFLLRTSLHSRKKHKNHPKHPNHSSHHSAHSSNHSSHTSHHNGHPTTHGDPHRGSSNPQLHPQHHLAGLLPHLHHQEPLTPEQLPHHQKQPGHHAHSPHHPPSSKHSKAFTAKHHHHHAK